MSGPDRREGGFTLVEALVALAIATLALTTLYKALGGGYRAAQRVKLRELALAHGQSHIDSIGADGLLAPGITTGSHDHGLTWRLSVAPLSEARDPSIVQPFWIELDLFEASAPLIKLETAKLGRLSK